MKEIDFIPDWYKNGKRQEVNCRTQYVALAAIFVVMVIWNVTASHSISRAEGEIAENTSKQMMSEEFFKALDKMKTDVMRLQEKESILEKIDSKISISNVLAEMSFLVNKEIVISNITFQAEKIISMQGSKVESANGLRFAGNKFSLNASSLFIGDVRFRITVSGVAAGAADVAELVCNLENSTYFGQVIPSFSRNRKMRSYGDLKKKENQVSEFEITCYLANYQQDGIRIKNKL